MGGQGTDGEVGESGCDLRSVAAVKRVFVRKAARFVCFFRLEKPLSRSVKTVTSKSMRMAESKCGQRRESWALDPRDILKRTVVFSLFSK